MTVELVTVPNVEIVATGKYQLSTGEVTFTQEDLEAAVASQNDPAIKPPRLKLGHESDWGDAEPCFGKVMNMRLSENRQAIIGDYVGVPAWLAPILATAFPSRSIEGAINATTATGKTHRLVIDAVSMLGVMLPGVSTLEDLADMYGDEQPEGTEITAGVAIAASRDEGETVLVGGEHLRGSVSTEDVRREYYEMLGEDKYLWWVTDIRLNPAELIVQDDDEGDLYRVPFSVTDDQVTFADPIAVEILFVDKTSEAVEATASRSRSVAVFASRDESRTLKQEDSMDHAKAIRASLGLPEDATDEQVHAALESLKASQSDDDKPTGESEDDGDESTETEGDESEAEGDEEQDGEPADEGTVRVDAKKWQETVSAAAEGRAARQEQLTERRERILASAVSDGKIAPASKDAWRKKLISAPEATEQELESLAAGLLPVEETPVAAGSDSTQDAYDANLFPELAAKRDTTITKEA